MLKNCKGFTLLEVIGSFSILLVVITVFLPIMMKLHEERANLQQKREALLLLHNETESYLYDSNLIRRKKEITTSTKTYTLTIEQEGEMEKLCIHWENFLNENGVLCNYVKK